MSVYLPIIGLHQHSLEMIPVVELKHYFQDFVHFG
ncbi:hypothetical protein CPS_3212 [Colwellia psychrerythraea 34H]|uniref:Uncharacterized protein n=1 Tax=Colwellia psychrerythraea (strain 34H / ATCC BAA-681) TaxID=167879 RepID=Q47Z62_COLP3|nr:hypothetical protein CPS_3212 [Colwellia psychrerythraea 34H]